MTETLHAFWLAMGIVFLAEMGDKTQLVAMCLASRFNVRTVLGGILAATLVVHVISVLLGSGVGNLLPTEYIKLLSGIAFIGFGLWTMRGDDLDDDECNAIQGKSPFWLVFTTFFLAELGDKTMLSTVAIATDYSMVPVWLGSSLGMVLSDGIAIIFGKIMGKKLPERAVKIFASLIFFGFGIWNCIEGAIILPSFAWIGGAVIVGVMILLYIRSTRSKSTSQLPSEVEEESEETVGVGR